MWARASSASSSVGFIGSPDDPGSGWVPVRFLERMTRFLGFSCWVKGQTGGRRPGQSGRRRNGPEATTYGPCRGKQARETLRPRMARLQDSAVFVRFMSGEACTGSLRDTPVVRSKGPMAEPLTESFDECNRHNGFQCEFVILVSRQ
jgi:hypothetical protein